MPFLKFKYLGLKLRTFSAHARANLFCHDNDNKSFTNDFTVLWYHYRTMN